MTMLGRAGGMALVEKDFATDGYSKEDLQDVADILKHRSRKTIWRTFESCNNYKLPDLIPERGTGIGFPETGAVCGDDRWTFAKRKRAVTENGASAAARFRCFSYSLERFSAFAACRAVSKQGASETRMQFSSSTAFLRSASLKRTPSQRITQEAPVSDATANVFRLAITVTHAFPGRMWAKTWLKWPPARSAPASVCGSPSVTA